MSYACVQDVPASWETYLALVAGLGDETPPGLLIHAAGPTEEGFRMIDVWETKAAFDRFHDVRLRPLGDREGDPPSLRRTIRELAVECVIRAAPP